MARQLLTQPRPSPKGLTYSLSFDGVDDRANSAANAGISGSGAFSMVAWIKQEEYVITNGNGFLSAGALSFDTGSGPIIAATGNDAGNLVQTPFINTVTGFTMPRDKWTHLAVTYAGGSGGQVKFYVNSNLVFSSTATGVVTNGPISIGGVFVSTIGSYIYSKNKTGPFAVYSDVLTLQEVQNIYALQDYPADNAIGIWRLTEGSGSTIADSSGNGLNLTITGAPVWSSSDLPFVPRTVAARRQSVLNFANSLVSTTATSSTSMSIGTGIYQFERTTPFSISCWIKFSSSGAIQVVFNESLTSAPFTGISLRVHATDTIRLWLINNSATNQLFNAVNLPPLNRWTHFVVTYDGSSTVGGIKFYYNAVLQTSASSGNTLTGSIVNASAATKWLSFASSNACFLGSILRQRIHNIELTQDQVTNLFYSDTSVGAVDEYLLTEGSGTSAVSTGSNPHNATLSGVGSTLNWNSTDTVKKLRTSVS